MFLAGFYEAGREVLPMGLRYFDSELGRERYKRRYVWAAWAYAAGLFSGVLLMAVLR